MSARDILRQRMTSIALESIGLVGGVTAAVNVDDVKRLEGDSIRAVAAQALIDGIASTPQGLVVRDILPDLDLRDNAGAADTLIGFRDWRQPLSGGTATIWLAAEAGTDRQTYRTSRSSDNDKKTFVYLGIRRTNIGPGHASTSINTVSIRFLRSNGSKVVDIWDLEEIDAIPTRALYARTPILYKKGDDQRIDFRPKISSVSSGQIDWLMILGKVAEPIGHNVTG